MQRGSSNKQTEEEKNGKIFIWKSPLWHSHTRTNTHTNWSHLVFVRRRCKHYCSKRLKLWAEGVRSLRPLTTLSEFLITNRTLIKAHKVNANARTNSYEYNIPITFCRLIYYLFSLFYPLAPATPFPSIHIRKVLLSHTVRCGALIAPFLLLFVGVIAVRLKIPDKKSIKSTSDEFERAPEHSVLCDVKPHTRNWFNFSTTTTTTTRSKYYAIYTCRKAIALIRSLIRVTQMGNWKLRFEMKCHRLRL